MEVRSETLGHGEGSAVRRVHIAPYHDRVHYFVGKTLLHVLRRLAGDPTSRFSSFHGLVVLHVNDNFAILISGNYFAILITLFKVSRKQLYGGKLQLRAFKRVDRSIDLLSVTGAQPIDTGR